MLLQYFVVEPPRLERQPRHTLKRQECGRHQFYSMNIVIAVHSILISVQSMHIMSYQIHFQIRFKSFQIYAFHSHRICVSYLIILSHPLSASLVPSILMAASAMAEHVRSTSVYRRRWLRQWMLLTCLAYIASVSSFTGTWAIISSFKKIC